MDLSSAPTGNTCYVLSEVYETEGGVADHYQQANDSWSEFRGGPRISDRLLRWDPDQREGVWNVPKETELPG